MRLRVLLALALISGALVGCSPREEGAPTATPTAGSGHASSGQTATPTPARGGTAGPTSPDAARVLAHIEQLAGEIGPRVAGSEGEARAVAYIAGEFREAGYAVEQLRFRPPDSPFRPASVMVAETRLDALPLGGSADGEVAGPAVYVGLAEADDVAVRSLEGAVAIADRGTITFLAKYEAVRAAGAAALVIVNTEPGVFLGTLQREVEIPVVAVGSEWRDLLLGAAAAGREVRVTVPAAAEVESVTVLARADPERPCTVLVGGHHDTVPGSPGANDNASGVAHVLELARAFAADGLDPGLCFATFGAEESGLHGSRELASRLAAEGALPQAMVNLDVTGIGPRVEVIGSLELVERTLEMAEDLGIPAAPGSLPPNASSDHASFAAHRVPVLFFTSGEFAEIHTPRDTVDRIEAAELERVGRLAFAAISDLLASLSQEREGP